MNRDTRPTLGLRKTLMERWRAEREARVAVRLDAGEEDTTTPTTDAVRAAYVRNPRWPRNDPLRRAEFDRWLAAHDAEKRAEWEAEQGEVEWAVNYTPDGMLNVTPEEVQDALAATEDVKLVRSDGTLTEAGQIYIADVRREALTDNRG